MSRRLLLSLLLAMVFLTLITSKTSSPPSASSSDCDPLHCTYDGNYYAEYYLVKRGLALIDDKNGVGKRNHGYFSELDDHRVIDTNPEVLHRFFLHFIAVPDTERWYSPKGWVKVHLIARGEMEVSGVPRLSVNIDQALNKTFTAPRWHRYVEYSDDSAGRRLMIINVNTEKGYIEVEGKWVKVSYTAGWKICLTCCLNTAPPSPDSVCWRLHLDGNVSGVPVRVGEYVYRTPAIIEYRAKKCVPQYGDVKKWSVEVKALGNGTWYPVKAEFWFKGWRGWEMGGSVRDVDGLLEARIYNDGAGRPVYRYYYYYDDTHYFYARDRWWFENIRDVKLYFYYRNSSSLAFLTVKTNIDDLIQSDVVSVNGSYVSTPWEYYSDKKINAALEAEAVYVRKDYKLRRESVSCWSRSTCTHTYKLRGELIVELDYYVGKDGLLEVYADGVRVLRVKGYHYPRVKRGHARLAVTVGRDVTIVLKWASLRNLEAYEGKRYLFEKWYVYDSEGDVVLDAPRLINVSVPVGERYTAVAYYRYEGATLKVDSRPSGVPVTYNDTVRTTPFTLTSDGDLAVRLEAPEKWSNYRFKNWTVYSNDVATTYTSTRIVLTVPRGETWRAVAYYFEGGGKKNYTTYRLSGEVYCLPYQWVHIPVNLTPGLWLINSSAAYPNPSNRTLINAFLGKPDSREKLVVPAINLLVNVTRVTSLPVYRECRGETCWPAYIVKCVNYPSYYLLGLGVGNYLDENETLKELRRLLLPNGTTLAIYNVSVVQVNVTNPVAYWRPVVVTSLSYELDAIYEEEGVYLVWNFSYSYLAPRWVHEWLNISEKKPYQLVYGRIWSEKGNLLFEQRLGMLPAELEYLGKDRVHSYAALYVSYAKLRKLLRFGSPALKCWVTWSGYHIPTVEPIRVGFVPAGIWLRGLEKKNDEWIWRVSPVEIPGNNLGKVIRLGGKFVTVFNGSRVEHEVQRGFEVFSFTTPRFEIGHHTLQVYYLPEPTRNLVYYFYPFDF